LSYPAKDAQDLAAALLSPEVGGWREQDIQVLANEQATLANVTSGIKRLLDVSGKGDFVLIYFSGHGFRSGESTCLALYETDPLKPETGFDLEQLRRWLQEKGSGALKLLILDACHSGKIIQSTRGTGGGVTTRGEDVFQDLNTILSGLSGGIGYITSSGSSETSKEGAANGVFTALLLDGLRRAPGEGRYVTLVDVWEYVRNRISAQTPQFAGDISMKIPLALRIKPPTGPVEERARDILARTLGDASAEQIRKIKGIKTSYRGRIHVQGQWLDMKGTQEIKYPDRSSDGISITDSFQTQSDKYEVSFRPGQSLVSRNGVRKEMSRESSEEISALAEREFLWIQKRIAEGDSQAERVGETEYSGRKADAVLLRYNGFETTLYVDRQTGVLAGIRYSSQPGAGRSRETEIRFSDYTNFGGIKYPAKIETVSEGEVQSAIEVREVTLLP
jgi:hypothetical protein